MIKAFLVFGILLFFIAAPAAEKTGPRVYISVDMEGIWGVVHGNQTSSDSPEYGPARKWMAEDTNAVIAGLFEAGAAEVVVNDSHGSMRNIIADTLDPRASLISGTPKPLSMMQGIDGTFDACVFVGYHARAGTASAILDHTISGGVVRAIRVNGQEMPELGLNAAIAGYFNVPVIMLTGDTETCAQAKSILGEGLTTVAVKEAQGRYAARNFPRDEARKQLKEGAQAALLKESQVAVFRLKAPYTFELDVNNSYQAELPCLVHLIKRSSPRTVEFSSDDYLAGFRLLRAAIALAGISYN
jgi:D-amino peptidase